MSAFVVNDLTISAIVKGFEIYSVDFRAEGYVVKSMGLMASIHDIRRGIGQCLLDCNYNSVNYRYQDKIEPRKFRYHDIKNINPGMIVGAINCFDYQACEAPINGLDYFQSMLHFSLMRLKDAILERYVKREGYDINWEVYPEDVEEGGL